MLQFIKDFFLKKTINSSSNTSEIISKNNNITFIVDKDNNLYIYVSTINLDITDSKIFADMLHGICGGKYTQDILSILLGLGKQDTAIENFVKNTIDQWSSVCVANNSINQKDNSSISNEPMIKPTIFFKSMMNNQNE